jgi:hypothetical protein
MLLSVGSPTKDEDPCVLLARDGSIYIVWFSDRGGNSDIYLTRTSDGIEWMPPVRITTSIHGDFYPQLIQDDAGVFHLTWFRWEAYFRGHIWYSRSENGITWDSTAEVQVTTTDNVDDWVPVITQAGNGTLVIYFVSAVRSSVTNEIYVTSRSPSDSQWSAATPLPAINSPTEHDHLPQAAQIDGTINLVWVRHDTSQSIPWLHPKSDLYFATSANGYDWSSPLKITTDSGNVVNLFPGFYTDDDGTGSLIWLSTRSGAPKVFELPVTDLTTIPQELSFLPDGYSHRVSRTTTPDVYIGVWVQGPDGEQNVYYRFFEK